MSGKKTIVDFGRNLKSDFREALKAMEPVLTINETRRRNGLSPIQSAHVQPLSITAALGPKTGEKVVVIQDDETLVKRSVVDAMRESCEMIDFWRERGLWVERVRMPNWEKVQSYVEQLEAEAEELRERRDLGESLEDLT